MLLTLVFDIEQVVEGVFLVVLLRCHVGCRGLMEDAARFEC